MKMALTVTVIAALAILGSGCAFNKVTVRDSTPVLLTNGVNVYFGVETRETIARTYAILDSKNTMDKQRVSNGKTHSIGQMGVTQEATSTNAIRALEILKDIVGSLPK